MRPSPFWSLLSVLAVALAGCARPAPDLPGAPERAVSWSRAVVEQMADVPLQQNGRVKPLSTTAAFLLYYVHGRRDLQYNVVDAAGSKQRITLSPTEWLCDVWCYPSQAANYPLFRIENTGVLDALGFANEGQRQGFEYLSYAQLEQEQVSTKLGELFREYARIDQGKRNEVQEHIVQLWRQLVTYSHVHQQLDALRHDLAVDDPKLAELLGATKLDLGALLAKARPLVEYLRGLGESLDNPENESASRFLMHLTRVTQYDDSGLRLVSPAAKGDKLQEWLTIGGAVNETLRGDNHGQAVVVALERAVRAGQHADKEAGLVAFARAAKDASVGRDDVRHVSLESRYYEESWQYRSIHWFLLGFVLAAASWLAPRNRLVWLASLAVTLLATGMLTYDVVLRCLITERPPIKNLYDTFLFIAATGALLGLIVEVVMPRRIALAAAPFVGALLVMFGRMFEVTKGEDTMDPLVAVLDSNFWLATHVTSINLGYSAALFAAVLALGWIWIRVLRIAAPSEPMAKALIRMVYGVTAFSLTFSVFGTILGGVWANDSWGRFWGWDPKENGALLICLSQVAMLHARMSGMIRDLGQIVWTAATGMVVVFSWFHTNLLGIGLHSYGFSSGLRDAVWISYTVVGASLLIGSLDVLLRPNPAPRRQGSSPVVHAVLAD